MTGTAEAQPFVPAGVRTMVERLETATGHRPGIAAHSGGRYRLTMASDRVTMTYDCRPTGKRGNKLQRLSSTLTVDGRRRELDPKQALVKAIMALVQGSFPEDSDEAPPVISRPARAAGKVATPAVRRGVIMRN